MRAEARNMAIKTPCINLKYLSHDKELQQKRNF